jgi:hypothetical protein
LQTVMLVERLLQRMKFAVRGKAFNRVQFGTVGLDRKDDARPRSLTVEVNGTGSANTVLAADMRTGEPEILPQEIGQQLARLAAPFAADAVDGELDGNELRHCVLFTASGERGAGRAS